MKKLITSWLAPLVVSILLFIAVRPAVAQLAEEPLVNTGSIQVGDEAGENGFRQIYYEQDGEKHFITDTSYPNGEPDFEGDYITWMGQAYGGAWQIFRYHIPTQTMIQVSGSVNNANPKVDEQGRVVWEGWADDEDSGKWQVFFFDATKVVQLTLGDLSMNPDIEGDYISYGRRDAAGTWRSVVYSISRSEAKEVATGISSKRPEVRDAKIILAGTGVEEEFPLNVEDLFLLDLAPLASSDSPSSVSISDILQELNTPPATDSASIQEATESARQ